MIVLYSDLMTGSKLPAESVRTGHLVADPHACRSGEAATDEPSSVETM